MEVRVVIHNLIHNLILITTSNLTLALSVTAKGFNREHFPTYPTSSTSSGGRSRLLPAVAELNCSIADITTGMENWQVSQTCNFIKLSI